LSDLTKVKEELKRTKTCFEEIMKAIRDKVMEKEASYSQLIREL
jgi:hypothetical protein